MPVRPQKITFGEMRSADVRGILVYRADYHCSHSIAINVDQWPEGGRELVTLLDAGNYITELPKADQQLDEWQTAD